MTLLLLKKTFFVSDEDVVELQMSTSVDIKINKNIILLKFVTPSFSSQTERK